NRILQKLAEIAIPGTPAGTINVPGKIGDSRLSNLLKNCSRLSGAWRARINHLWRKSRIRGNNAQYQRNRVRAYWNPILGSWQHSSAVEALEHGMLLFNAGITISARADDLPCHLCTEDAGQLKIGPEVAPLGIARSFKGGEKGASVLDVLANGIALSITEVCGIRNQDRAVFPQGRRMEFSFVHNVEEE